MSSARSSSVASPFPSSLPNLVLIGAGHSHCVALANWHRQKQTPIANITLITPTEKTIYSGSVPGYLAGLSDRSACELTVESTVQSTVDSTVGTALGINMILDEVVGLDLSQQQVICRNHAPIGFDIASLNLGSTPRLPPGVTASDRVIPMKPMAQMLYRLESHLEQAFVRSAESRTAESRTSNPVSLAIVGGGLGGVEIALSLNARWGDALEMALICRGTIVASQPQVLQRFLRTELERRNIKIYDQTTVETAQERDDHVILQMTSGQSLVCDVSLWATDATAPEWLRSSGLATDDRGFVVVDRTLRSISHPALFASGDIATLQDVACPKAGVLAVRQGHTLGQNLPRQLAHQPLCRFKPRSRYLSLISLGNGRAVASYGRSALIHSPFQSMLGYWKRSIDREFVDRINLRS